MRGFDVDGTLLDYGLRVHPQLNEQVLDTLESGERIALITNQGGIPFALANALRPDGNITPYPTPGMFRNRLAALLAELERRSIVVDAVYACVYHPRADQRYVAYARDAVEAVAKTSGWGNVLVFYTAEFRKPSPVMLQYAGITSFYGDSDEDEQAAQAAGVPFTRVARFHGSGA